MLIIVLVPRGAMLGDLIADEDQLCLGNRTTPNPKLMTFGFRRTTGVKPHVLFEKAKHVLDSKTPKIDLAEISQCDTLGTGPEEIERSLKAWRPICLEKLDGQHKPNKCREAVEMQIVPGAKADGLAEHGGHLLAIRLSVWVT